MRARLLLLSAFLFGCGSYKEDVETLCNVKERSDATSAALDPAQRAMKEASYLDKHLRSKEGRALFSALGTAPNPAARAALVRDAAAKNGVAPCPYVTDMEAASKP